jgi:hypothetical protein
MRPTPIAEVRLEEDKAESSSATSGATIASGAGGTHCEWSFAPSTPHKPDNDVRRRGDPGNVGISSRWLG